MSQIIDRRQNAGKKSMVNRQRFLRRYRNQIKKAVSDAIVKRRITEIDQGEKITIPAKDIAEPFFHFGTGGRVERILPGNDRFTQGDKIKRPEQGAESSGGGQASNQEGSLEDDFIFEISREEFLDIYFEDLALPLLLKKDLANITQFKTVRAGVVTSGNPTNIHVVRSMRQAASRRIALQSPYKNKLHIAEAQLKASETSENSIPEERSKLQQDIALYQKKIKSVPFIDTIDLRYHHRVKVPQPTTNALMFCIMDVSGSMDEAKKEIAKRFFILLYLFLTKNYERIELIFIRHHTSAKEVGEEEFFYSRETGGTVVSSALELLYQIIETRYPPSHWNIYAAQASDGDNWNADSPYCQELLQDKIMPLLQYFAYIEIMPRHHQSLWEMYQHVQAQFPNFAMENIDTLADIYPVFRELFKKERT